MLNSKTYQRFNGDDGGGKQAGAEVVPSSSLVEVGVKVSIEVMVGVDAGVGVEVGLSLGSRCC